MLVRLVLLLVASAGAFQVPSAAAPRAATATVRSAAPVAGMFDFIGTPKEADDESEKPEKEGPKITLDGLMQVMSMGAGAPMLGDLKKTNFKKPEAEAGAALQFELEANNFDLNDRGKYFDSGNVDAGEYDGPGFFENLMSGGKLQREYDKQLQAKQGKKR